MAIEDKNSKSTEIKNMEIDKKFESAVEAEAIRVWQNCSEQDKAKLIKKRFSPGESSGYQSKSGGNYMKDTENEYGSKTFFKDVISAGTPGGMETNSLRNWIAKTGEMSEGDLASGGYLVPSPLSGIILLKSLEKSIVRPRATPIPMSSNRLEIPADVGLDHTSSLGGITIYRPGEAGQKTASNPTLGKISLQLHKLVGLVYVSDELLQDSGPAMEVYLTRKFAQAISFVEDDDFLNGTGVNMALGALNSGNPSLITVDAIGGQGANTIIAENVAAMWARLWPDGQSNAVWIANIETFPQLFGMAISVGAGGVPVWMPASQLSDKPYGSLMGRPLIFTEKCPALGTAGDIALCDFSQYYIADRNNSGGVPEVASSIHLKFDYDQTAFRFVLRYDGQPTWLSTMTPKRGSKTLSPFIVLSGSRT
jgi:HK97 family phage major capsid protein